MTNRELIALLAELPLDLEVLYTDDGFYREADEVEIRIYDSPGEPDTTANEKRFILLS